MLSGQDAHPAIDDYSYRNPNRFSRLKALQDLLIRFQKAKLASKDMDVNIAQLLKGMGMESPGGAGLCWPASKVWDSGDVQQVNQ